METAKQVLHRMNDYNRQVNADFIKHLETAAPGNERIPLLMSHIINAHQIWLERMKGERMSVKVFELRTYEQMKEQIEKNHSLTADIFENRDLEEEVNYVNTQRQRFRNTILEMFLHLFNHSSYHRGQINQLLVQEGKQAMVSDFIVYSRTELFE